MDRDIANTDLGLVPVHGHLVADDLLDEYPEWLAPGRHVLVATVTMHPPTKGGCQAGTVSFLDVHGQLSPAS
jgi:hypothetical protein